MVTLVTGGILGMVFYRSKSIYIFSYLVLKLYGNFSPSSFVEDPTLSFFPLGGDSNAPYSSCLYGFLLQFSLRGFFLSYITQDNMVVQCIDYIMV